MVKKIIEFIEAAALIILTAACVVGGMKYLDYRTEEPKEDTPIVEEVEILKFTITDYYDGELEFEFEEGMTWGQWLASEYNTKYEYYEVIGSTFYLSMSPLISDIHSEYLTVNDLIVPNVNYHFTS